MINTSAYVDQAAIRFDYAAAQQDEVRSEKQDQEDQERAVMLHGPGPIQLPTVVPAFFVEPTSPGDLDGAGGALTSSPASIEGDPIEPDSKNSLVFYAQNKGLLSI